MGDAGQAIWPEGKKGAISLAFDGGLPEHVELIAPLLDEHEIKATFFVTIPLLLENQSAWRTIAASGHEIASHSLLGVSDDGHLPAWTIAMVQDDLRMTEKGIAEVLGCPVASFAKPGSLTTCADGDYLPSVRRQYSYIRGIRSVGNPLGETDLQDVGAYRWDNLVGPIESLLPGDEEWTVAVFDHFFRPDVLAAEDDLRVLLGYLKRRDHIWAAPFGEVGGAVSKLRGSTGVVA